MFQLVTGILQQSQPSQKNYYCFIISVKKVPWNVCLLFDMFLIVFHFFWPDFYSSTSVMNSAHEKAVLEFPFYSMKEQFAAIYVKYLAMKRSFYSQKQLPCAAGTVVFLLSLLSNYVARLWQKTIFYDHPDILWRVFRVQKIQDTIYNSYSLIRYKGNISGLHTWPIMTFQYAFLSNLSIVKVLRV